MFACQKVEQLLDRLLFTSLSGDRARVKQEQVIEEAARGRERKRIRNR